LVVSIDNQIKQQYKKLRKSHKMKLADSVVAATALTLNIPLITADKQFKSISALQLIQYGK
jgi:predicted nucleic acid-binding protein